MRVRNTKISVVQGSLVEQEVNVIVNAASPFMRGGGGIDGVVHQCAGPLLLDELVKRAPYGAPVGMPVTTKAYHLPFDYIIHVAGPVWQRGERGEALALQQCYHFALVEAQRLQAESIGFCSISTGIYGYPVEEAAPLALRVTHDFLQANPGTSLERVVFAMYCETEYQAFQQALAALEAAYIAQEINEAPFAQHGDLFS